ncbi:MAG: Mrp/NBP35 family ATP-binding protein [Gaiellales bacterium]|nr:Mrp/NBP35 family ATP-binding protein [Gaiellales bacterium]
MSMECQQTDQRLESRMSQISQKLLVLSGKGGVGKSTVAVNLALALQRAGKKVGLLDVDVHGPSVPTMLRLSDRPVPIDEQNLLPVMYRGHLPVMSIGLFLDSSDSAVVWRGPMKYSAIEQLLRDTEWGQLDHLVVDCPPGTGDEPLSVIQMMHPTAADGAVIVTTPQDLALVDVRRSIRFCQLLKLRILGVVENMDGFTCPNCGSHYNIFSSGGGRELAAKFKVPFLGSLPIDPAVVECGDSGAPVVESHPDSVPAQSFAQMAAILAGRQQ